MPKNHVKNPKIFVAYIRVTENFSTTNVIAGSIKEIDEVKKIEDMPRAKVCKLINL